MSYEVNTTQLGAFSVTLTGGTATGAASVAAIPNPEGVDLVISDAALYVVNNSTGATNLTIGTASSGTVAATSMMGATAMAAAAGKVFGLTYHGTAIATERTKWGSAGYINVAGSASTAGLEAILFVKYFRAG